MSAPLMIATPGNERMAAKLGPCLAAEIGHLEFRKFPDGETYLRFATDPAGRRLSLLCTLVDPDSKILPLIFAAATARELGAIEVGLIAPYLAYMRQDRRFNPGEAVTSRLVARLLSEAFDWLVTVDPHLHRYSSLGEIYTIPTCVVHAASSISSWIRTHVENPIIIGPDSESEQWVSEVAKEADAPYTVLEKVRHGDRDVKISIENSDRLPGRTPVLVDDIISSGRTMLEAARLVSREGARPVCVAVHGVFADRSDELLEQAGARVITCNCILHRTNEIDMAEALADAVRAMSR
ncbi:MAG: ribose-phosphate pyrophosphokinase [Hyphomicrobiales bacterium]|nr:MAG: ribose-phosphate pyrophosphokinase [Hyphomicrobiales bacterium]